jgi:DUF971 family protein
MTENIRLTEIRRSSDGLSARLTWNDGHSSEVSYSYLRGFCPCAGCQGHSAGPVVFQKSPDDIRANNTEPVGNYAVSFHFSDGHATGIYRFEFLRQICPCEVCRVARGAVGTEVQS